MRLADHLRADMVLIAPDVGDRDELFARFAERFREVGLIADPTAVVARLLDREAILSTGIGAGVAVPHAQLPAFGRVAMAASTHPEGLSYPSLDGQPVRLVLCLLGDTDTAADHLAGLARLARLARRGEALDDLVHAATPRIFLDTLGRFEG